MPLLSFAPGAHALAADWASEKAGEVLERSEVAEMWKSMTAKERRNWKEWAKVNCLYIETVATTSCRIVGAHRAFGTIMNNRRMAGESLTASTTPTSVDWAAQFSAALSTRDAGPFTENAGYVGFRVDKDLATSTDWFVWATPPVGREAELPKARPRYLRQMEFVTPFSLDPIKRNELIPALNEKYQNALGLFDGPGVDGEWPKDTFIWFKLRQYVDGQLGPAQVMSGRIQIQL